jgi:hypothetical protein
MIKNEKKYLTWIENNGVGSNDKVASSTKSYISYLNSVSKLIREDISEKNLYDENCIDLISKKIIGMKSDKTISNYKSALRQYVKMVQNA